MKDPVIPLDSTVLQFSSVTPERGNGTGTNTGDVVVRKMMNPN